MSLYRPKHSKNWMCQILHKGQWFRRSTGTPDRKQAELKEQQFRKEFITERGLRKSITLRDALQMYVDSKKGTSNHVNLERQKNVLEDFLRPLTDLHEIDTPSVTRLVEKLRRSESNSTIKHRLQTLRSTINLARDNGYMVPELKYPKLKTKKGRTRVLSDDEIQSILNELDPSKQSDGWSLGEEAKRFRQDAYDLWVLFCNTGARFTEISKLEWSQVSIKNRTIQLYRSKVDNETVLVMTDRAHEVFARRSRKPLHNRFVFPNRKLDGPRGYTGKAIRNAIKRAGLSVDVSPHVTRHTVATRLLEAGMNVQEVQWQLGHADPQTTMRYLHASTQSAAKRAAEILNRKDQPKLAAVK